MVLPIFDIITCIPEAYPGLLGHSLVGNALKKHLWELNVYNFYDYADNKHRKIDDRPFGGGAGLVLRPDIVAKAIEQARLKDGVDTQREIIYASPAGCRFDSSLAKEWSCSYGKIFLCGRFEGVDQRVLDAYHVKEVSAGDFILCGGDSAVQMMLEAVIRLLPNTVGSYQSLEHESFSDGLLEHAHYTLPRDWQGYKVPDVLLSGNHKDIAQWRHDNAKERTQTRRRDLWERYCHKQS